MSDEAPAPEGTLAPGDALPEGHRVEELLAVGRIGTAYVVRGPDGERRAAHVLHADRVDALREWFVKSAWLRESIDHPHLPRTYAVGTTDEGCPAEVTELLEGETLREALANRSAPIPLGVVARVVRELAAALDHLHGRATPVVHRALTPECVLLTAPDGVVKLLGVGDADRPEADAVRPSYLAPEALAELTVTPRADVFVLASLAYEMLTGAPAFPGSRDEVLTRQRDATRPSVAAARAEIPAAVDETLHSCWALAADQRPTCAMEFALAFSTALGVDDTSEHPVTNDTEGGGASLQVMRRRSALLGPTQEVPAPDLGSTRSFLGPAEKTEVSVSAVPEKPTPPRAAAVLRPVRSTLRDDNPRGLDPAPPKKPDDDPLARTITGVSPTAPPAASQGAPAPQSAPAPRPSPSPVPPPAEPARPADAPFANDLRSTLQTQGPLLDDSNEPTPRHEPAPQPAPQPVPAAKAAPQAAPRPAPQPMQVVTPGPKPSPLPAPQPAPAPATVTAPRPVAGRSDPPPADLFAPPPHAPEMPATMPIPSPAAASTPAAPTPTAPPRGPSTLPPPSQPQASAAPGASASSPRAPGPEASELATRKAKRGHRGPEEIAFPDEPTSTVPVSPPRPQESLWRSPIVVASIFLANAILIVGVAHAIALVANREPAVRVVQGPAPVCAPCAPCAACPPPPPAAMPSTPAVHPAPAPAPAPRTGLRPVPRRQALPF
ncbi:MAG: protein kinase [Polyangiales bacterium]